MHALKRIAAERLPGLAVIALALLAIEVTTREGWINASLLPPPSRIGEVLWALLAGGDFLRPLGATLRHLGVGFAIGASMGVIVGIAMGYWRPVYALLEPIIEMVRPLPKPALVPALILFLGVDDAMKNVSVALAVFFPVLLNALQGTKSVDRTLIDTARTFGYGDLQIVRKIVLPAVLPYVLAGMRIAVGLGLILAVLSEMMAGNDGLGFLIVDMQRAFRVRQMYAWLVILAIVGFALNEIMVKIERTTLKWRPGNALVS
jgi:ABC-type nitrate/sulfonate/bicarbonate transport system permease component